MPLAFPEVFDSSYSRFSQMDFISFTPSKLFFVVSG